MEFPVTPHDPSIVTLNADQKAVALKKVRDTISALGHLGNLIETESLEVGHGLNVLHVAEYSLADISKLTKIETDSAAERERRHAQLRAANMRVHELERQMGEAAGVAHVQMGIRDLGKKLNSWWDLEGFGHISSIRFTDYGNCEVVFSCMLFGRYHIIDSPTPLSDKERKALWLKSLEERGFLLCDDPDEKDHIQDCDATREALCQLFASRLPSAKVIEFTNHRSRLRGFHLRDVKVFIYNLEDIVQLPQAPQETQ